MSTGTIKQLLGIKKSVPLTLTAKVTDNGGPSSLSDRVHITVNRGLPCPPTNFPPVLRTISPPNNSVFRAAINLSVYAYAADKDGFVTGVEFFAGTNNLERAARSPRPLNVLVRLSPSWLFAPGSFGCQMPMHWVFGFPIKMPPPSAAATPL